jgi:Tol biopolymer transport system component
MKLTRYLAISSVLVAPMMSAQDVAQPELVEPGVISTPLDEYDNTFTPDGDTLYYAISAPGSAAGQAGVIMRSVRRDGHWTPPVVAPFSGQYDDADPSISPDGKRLFFASTRPVDGKPKSGADYDIWVVDRTATGWGEPTNLGPPVNSTAAEFYPVVTADGTLYFFKRRPNKGHWNMYRSHLVDGHYGTPENLGPTLNGTFDNTDIALAPDQSYIIFTSYGRPDGLGNGDLYISFHRHGAWTTPKNLGAPLNSTALEYGPRLSPDGKYLYYTSNRGFGDRPLSRRLSTDEYRDSLTSIRNGNGNIYRVPLAPLLAAMQPTSP